MAKKIVDEVRKALEGVGAVTVPEDAGMTPETRLFAVLSQALVTEGLRVLDNYTKIKIKYKKTLKNRNDDVYREYLPAELYAEVKRISFIATILRTAGRMK